MLATKHIKPKWLVGLSLMALAIFLLIWLRNEYRGERAMMQETIELTYKNKALEESLKKVDLYVEQLNSGIVHEHLSLDSPESFLSSFMGLESMGANVITIAIDSSESSFPPSGFFDMKMLSEGADSIFIDRNFSYNGDFESQLTDKQRVAYQAELMATNQQAIWGIIPQIFYALLLYGLCVLAIYALQKSHKEQKMLLSMKNDFISNMTHELKTPVATISVALEAIQNFNVHQQKEKADKYMAISQKELHRLSMLIDQVLNFSALEDGQLNLQSRPLSFSNILDEVIDTFGPRIEEQKAVINKELIGQEFVIRGDEIHLKNLLYNLIDNSLKYSSDKNTQIQFRLEEKKDQLVFSISDNGKGIPKAFQEKVFERFFRVPSGNVHNVKGYGLGLSYVDKIVEAHQGAIHLKSEESKGTSITIKFLKYEQA